MSVFCGSGRSWLTKCQWAQPLVTQATMTVVGWSVNGALTAQLAQPPVWRAGCTWRLLPNDLAPWGTIYRWFAVWRDDGCFERINHALVIADRERVGREASPTAAIIDSQSAKTTEAGGPRGCVEKN
jgi:transposase